MGIQNFFNIGAKEIKDAFVHLGPGKKNGGLVREIVLKVDDILEIMPIKTKANVYAHFDYELRNITGAKIRTASGSVFEVPSPNSRITYNAFDVYQDVLDIINRARKKGFAKYYDNI